MQGTEITGHKIENMTKRELPEKIKFVVERESSTKSEEIISMLEQKTMRKEDNKGIQRRSKHDLKGRDYLCTMCWKSYLSYAAMYVHLKKKHKTTIEGLKTSYFKRNKVSPMDLLAKVRQKANYRKFEESFDKIFIKTFCEVHEENLGKYSEFFNQNKWPDYKSHPFFAQIATFYLIFKDKPLLEKIKTEDLITNMDNAISMFIFGYWCYNRSDENLMNLRIAFLFREFLNFIGWDHLQMLADYKIVEQNFSNLNEDYSKCMLTENLPELLDDFLGIFMNKDSPNFSHEFSEIKYFITEFCNFLHNEGLINYMIEPVE